MQGSTHSEIPSLAISRADALWIALRFFGLFLLLLALEHLVNIVQGLVMIVISAVYLSERGGVLGFQVQMLISSGIRLVIFVALGIYLLRNGRAVFRGLWALTSVSPGTAEEKPQELS